MLSVYRVHPGLSVNTIIISKVTRNGLILPQYNMYSMGHYMLPYLRPFDIQYIVDISFNNYKLKKKIYGIFIRNGLKMNAAKLGIFIILMSKNVVCFTKLKQTTFSCHQITKYLKFA